MRIAVIAVLMLLYSCVSTKNFQALQSDNTRLKADSSILENRIRVLKDQVHFLENQSATIEQTLTNRLQEKQDSLLQKQAEIKQRESFLNDMKARKAQEQEAFANLSGTITKSFTGYASNDLASYTNCTFTVVEFSDRILFMPQSSKTDPAKAAKLFSHIQEVMSKQPDLKLWIVAHTDSVYTGKEKWDDTYSFGSAKANTICKQLIKEYKIDAKRLSPATQAEHIPLLPQCAGLGKNRVTLLFYSELLPCIHTTD